MSEAASTTAREDTAAAMPAGDVFATRHDGTFFEYEGRFDDRSLDELLLWAGDRKSSDIRIQTDRQVMAEIGSEIVPVTRREITQPEIEILIRYIYGEHGAGQIKAGYDLDPSHEVRMGRRGIKRYRVNITGIRIPGGDGVQITIRTLPTSPVPLEKLGVEPEIVANVRPKNGLVLVTGPTGSGKSTLLSSIVRHIVEKPDANEVVLEYSAPIEYVYDDVPMPSSSVAQSEVGRHLRPREDQKVRSDESLFAHAVRNSLRRKPTIILIGESRDRATIQASVEAALTGHLLFSTMHVIGVAETLRRAVQPFSGDERDAMAVDIMQSMRMVVTQLLFPKKGGGRVACREFMIFDERTRGQFLNKPVNDWPAFARRLMAAGSVVSRRMSESAWKLYEAGQIEGGVFKQIVASERDRA